MRGVICRQLKLTNHCQYSHVRVGTRLISPPPIMYYSIEVLKGRIRGLRALNREQDFHKNGFHAGFGEIAGGSGEGRC